MPMNWGSSRSGEIDPDIRLIPNISTAKPSMMPPAFLVEFFFVNIQSKMPATATTPVRISVLK